MVDPDALPMMFTPQAYGFAAKAINFLGGAAFLFATVSFIDRYRREGRADDYIFGLHCLLFGIAGVLFALSSMWNSVWWFFHVLRFVAYGIVVYFVVKTFAEIQKQLRDAY